MLFAALFLAAIASPAPGREHIEHVATTEVTAADREAAATTAGVGAFVGITLGGVVVPGVAGFVGGQIGARPSSSDLVLLTTVGGAAGAGIGGGLGALPTAEPWLGPPLVGAAAIVGSLVGLLPQTYFAQQKPATVDPNDPVRLAQSGCLLLGLVAATSASAGTGALLAAPGAGQ